MATQNFQVVRTFNDGNVFAEDAGNFAPRAVSFALEAATADQTQVASLTVVMVKGEIVETVAEVDFSGEAPAMKWAS